MLTATAERTPHLRRATWLSAAALIVVAAIVFALSYRPGASVEPVAARRTVELTSSARHRFTTVEQLVAASDLVVEGHTVATEAGRIFGDDTGAVRSQVTTLRVDTMLKGTSPETTVLIEEESELPDGTPVRVDGMRASAVGDHGVWFLVASQDPDFPGYVVVNAQGRYLRGTGDSLRGGDRTDSLVRSVEAAGFNALATAPLAGRL